MVNWISSLLSLAKLSRRKASYSRRANHLVRRPRLEALENRQLLSITVNTLVDEADGVGVGDISLRDAIVSASPGDVINFQTGLNGTITLIHGALPDISKSLTIDATGHTIAINAGGNGLASGYTSRIFNITDTSEDGLDPPEVVLIGLTLTGGDVAGAGGAIRSEGLLTLQNCTVTDNAAEEGAGIATTTNYATLDVQSSHITGNQSSTRGGGIAFYGTTLTLANTEITDNAANGIFDLYYSPFNGGGGIWANTITGSVELQGCTISENSTAANGGGIFLLGSDAELSILQGSVISGNTAANAGGGISAAGDYAQLDVQSSLITGNDSLTIGGGILFSGSNLTLQSSEIRDNDSHSVGYGTSFSGGGGLWATLLSGSATIEQSIFDNNTSTGTNVVGAGAHIELNGAYLTITGSVISCNQALGTADANIGGLAVEANSGSNVLIERSKITGNHADDDVGGLYIQNSDSTVIVTNSTVSGNTANGNSSSTYDAAGGVWIMTANGGTTTIESSTISGNKAVALPDTDPTNLPGGGLFIQNYVESTTIICNTTISDNQAEGAGGGIKIYSGGGGEIHILHSTIYGNLANSDGDGIGTGGGIDVGGSTAKVILDHTIVAGNLRGTSIGTTRDDISGLVEAAWSLIGDDTGATITDSLGNPIGDGDEGNQIGDNMTPKDPLLGLLAWNGGFTETHALLAGSPAIDAGDPTAVPNVNGVPEFDQRGEGFSRKYGSAVDIGAYEVGLAKVIQVVVSGSSSTHDPYDFAGVVGSGEQIRTIPVGGADTIQIRFSEAVTASSGDVTVQSAITSSFYTGSLTMSADGRTATWQLTSGVFVADQIVLHVDDGITGLVGALDGEWTNPTSLAATGTSTFPSGNGTAGGDFTFYFTVLSGDFGRNNMIDASDWILWRKWSGKTSGALFKQGDADGDGDVDQTDYNIWQSEFGLDFTVWPT